MPNKSTLRSLYRTKRKALSITDLAHASAAILKRVVVENRIENGLIMLYLDSTSHHEIPMEKWFAAFEKHPICVPKVVNTNGQMEAVLWEKGTRLEPNKWGIPEPLSTPYINPQNIAAVVVPLLCFDQNGHRVGYGKGYYDRFLSRCAPSCKAVGVSFYDPIEKIDDVEPTDVALDMVITPKGVYTF